MLKPHFVALLNFISEEKGGRKTPTSSGYRATIKFSLATEPILGEYNFLETDLVYSGDSATAEIAIVDIQKLNSQLYNGLDFDFYEGENLMGNGVITKCMDNIIIK